MSHRTYRSPCGLLYVFAKFLPILTGGRLEMAKVKGKYIPLTTAFTDDGRTVSEVRMARQVRFWVEREAPGFYLFGETGEFLTVVTSERKAVLEIVQRECQGSVPI